MNQIVLTGMVLSTAPVGEYDRRVVILTKEQGKISAFAKGARRPNSPLVGAVNPLSFGEFTLYEGRSSYTIQSANITNYFADLRTDIEGAYYGFYFLEIAGYYTKEFNDEREMLGLLYQSMKALLNPHIPNLLIRYIFELKASALTGRDPRYFSAFCAGIKNGRLYSARRKAGLCAVDCGADVKDGIILDNSTLFCMQFIESSRIEKLYTFNVTEQVLAQLGTVMKRLMDLYVDKKIQIPGDTGNSSAVK